MATEALGEERPALFLRKATGLVRGWSVRDSLIYAVLATNFVTLGIYEFTFAGPAFPKGQLITAVVISGNILAVQLFEPLWATLKWTWPAGGAAWFGTKNGIFVVTLITIALAGILVSIGMAGYARIQRWCFIGGMIGFLVVVGLLLFNSHASFVSSFNLEAHKLFGVNNA